MFFSKTGRTDFLETDVQQPNTTATLSCVSSCDAFSAKSGQFDAGSTTTASSFLPSSPPFLFCSSIIIRTVSFSVVSLMAIVPESECRMPTLIGPGACACVVSASAATIAHAMSKYCQSFHTSLLVVRERAYIWICRPTPTRVPLVFTALKSVLMTKNISRALNSLMT